MSGTVPPSPSSASLPGRGERSSGGRSLVEYSSDLVGDVVEEASEPGLVSVRVQSQGAGLGLSSSSDPVWNFPISISQGPDGEPDPVPVLSGSGSPVMFLCLFLSFSWEEGRKVELIWDEGTHDFFSLLKLKRRIF